MFFNSLIPFLVATLVVHARPHNQPGSFWTPGSVRVPLALHKVNKHIQPCGSEPSGLPPPFQAVPPFDGNPKIQAIFGQEKLALTVEIPPAKDSALKVGRLQASWGRRERRKRSLADDSDVQEARTIPVQIMDEINDDSSPVEVRSSLDGVPILQKRLRQHKQRSLQTHDYKMLDPADNKTGHKDNYPAKGYAREGDSVKGADIGVLGAV